jgi:hypothetical protein
MSKYFLILLMFLLSSNAKAQTDDSIFVVHKNSQLYVKHKIKFAETLHMLSVRFYTSDGAIENANDADILKKFTPGAFVYIPVTRENFYINKQTFQDLRELYYRVVPRDDIGLLSTYAGVTKSQMRMWNSLKGNTLKEDDVLFFGWIKMMSYDTANPATFNAYPMYKKRPAADTGKVAKIPGNLDSVYNLQTNNGTNILTERGTAVFFEKTGRNNIYYAFHNASQRGAVIKVFNPSNGKTIYVKVLGPIPDTKLYANSIIGICDAAKEDLGVMDNKAWCELSYSPN